MSAPGGPLSRLLLGPGPAGYGLTPITGLMGFVLTSWTAGTFQNEITDGSTVTYKNVPVLNPGALTGLVLPFRVLVAVSPSGPVILGPLYKYEGT